MKKYLLFLLISAGFVTLTNAQAPVKIITIKGTVIDSALNKPMGFVTVALQDATTKTPVKSNLSKDDGSFELKAPQGKNYQLALVFIGYKSKTIIIHDTAAEINLGKILLTPSVNQLKEVAISAARPIMKQEVDRLTYDVQADPESKALDGLDMIRKVPLLSVDGTDNILLKGSSNYKILINGKESALMAKSPSDVLKSMPANNIQRIEVITTPPAKYDAEGLVGIINIVTKKNAIQGYTGTFNSRFNSVYGLGANLNLSAKQGKFGIEGFIGYNGQRSQQTMSANTQDFFALKSMLSQTSSSSGHGHGNYYDTELSYDIDSLNLLTASFDINQNQFLNDGSQQSNTINSAGAVTQGYLLNNVNHSNYQGMDVGINYQLGFKKSKDQLLTLSYRFSYSPNTQYSDLSLFNRVNYPQPDYNQTNSSGNRTHVVQLDYVQPVNKFLSVDAGAKGVFRSNYSNFQSDTLNSSGQFILNPALTNAFNYKQDVLGFYNSYQVKTVKWAAKAGLRLEHTQINADFTSAGSSVAQNYNNFIPSVSIQRILKGSSINFGFTQRIQRPGIYQLNPFVDHSNPNFITTGNLNLRPELSNTFELTYSNFKKTPVTMGFSYAFSNNSIQNVTSIGQQTVNGKTDTVTTTTYRNLGSNNRLGFNINTNYPITKHLTLNMNGQISRIGLKGTFNGQFYTNSGIVGNIFGNLGYKFTSGYRIGVDAAYYSGSVNLQGKSGDYIYVSHVFSKDLFKAKATVSLVANNPYSKFWSSESNTTTADFYQQSLNQQTYRTFAVRFNYRFGQLKSEIRKNKRGINNDDTKSN